MKSSAILISENNRLQVLGIVTIRITAIVPLELFSAYDFRSGVNLAIRDLLAPTEPVLFRYYWLHALLPG